MGKSKGTQELSSQSQQVNHLYQASQLILSKRVQSKQSLNKNSVFGYYSCVAMSCAKKNVYKIEHEVKRNICKGCEGLLVPGVTAQVRLCKKSHVLRWKCMQCLTNKNFLATKSYEPWFQTASFVCKAREEVKNVNEVTDK